MNVQLWSWLLTIVGLSGFILAGRRVWWCWYINLGCQLLWFAYAFTTRQYGFIASAIVYSAVFVQNATKWSREHRKGKESVSLDDLIRKCIDEEHAIIERAAEQAIQSGSHGVKVLRTVDGLFVSAEVSDEVPFGRIHEHRDQNGLRYDSFLGQE